MSRQEFDVWRVRSGLIPFGWRRTEGEAARIQAASSMGGGSAREAFVDYLEVMDDEENIKAQAIAHFKNKKAENGK